MMRRNKWAVGLVVSALSVGCGAGVTSHEEGVGSVMRSPLAAAWAAGVAYTAGTQVTYGGATYTCLQAHTSQTGWEPPNVPALWQAGTTGGGTTGGGDTTAPSASLSANSTSFTAAGTLNLTATASDNVGVTKVEIYQNGSLVATAKTYSRTFASGQNGTYTYMVKAYDAAGNVGSQSLTVTVQIGGGTTPPPSGGKKIVAYFTAWGIYGRNYQPSNIPAGKITHLNYAFSNVSSDGKCVLGDSYADIDKAGGYPNEWDAGQLRGNFRAIKEMKKTYPNLKAIISIGGWSWSKYFSQVAASSASRSTFVKSCVDLYIRGQYPGVTSPNGDGVFDGVDIDWEYPTGGGLPDNLSSPSDKANYTLLMQEFRNQLNSVASQTGKTYLLTIASGASPDLLANKQESKNLSNILDWINVMSYDYHGAFESSTNFQAALNRVTGDPMAASGFYDDGSVSKLLSLGVPASKIVLGVPFYGRGWGSVGSTNNGLFQSGAPTKGTWDDGSSGLTGVFDYKDIKNNYEGKAGYTKYFNAEAKEAYIYNPSTKIWIAYDDTQSMSAKADYILSKGLGGAMAWELSSDDGTLLDTLYQKLK